MKKAVMVLLLAVLSAACASARDVSGSWNFICCSGKYFGEMILTEEDSEIRGHFFDQANQSGGKIEGSVRGNTVLFSRNKGEQDYKLTLSEDGSTMYGYFVGAHDPSAGTEVTFTRK